MSNSPEETTQFGMFENENIAEGTSHSEWKAQYVEEMRAKTASIDREPLSVSTPVEASSLPQEWMDSTEPVSPIVEPLKLRKCTRSECDKGLHCFRLTKKQAQQKEPGQCRTCDEIPVEFDRIRKRELSDINYTFDALRLEWIRHEYWTCDIDSKALGYAKRKGLDKLLESVEDKLRKAVSKPISPENAFEGRQTSWEGNPIHYAQHATATCCRRCMEFWHGIPSESELTAEQLTYLSNLVQAYLKERFGHIRNHPVKVSPLKQRDKQTLPLDLD